MSGTSAYGLGEFTFPRGWFMVAEASELENGPIAVRFFANDFVIYRGQSGKIVMLDAYCPHMGTHLCKNTSSYIVHDGTQVHGDSIRCPYHAWSFGPDGKCDDIPYAKRIPKPVATDAVDMMPGGFGYDRAVVERTVIRDRELGQPAQRRFGDNQLLPVGRDDGAVGAHHV